MGRQMASGIPQYIIMMEDAQKKAKRVGMPIANIELVMMASTAVLAVTHFTCKVDDWKGLPTGKRMCRQHGKWLFVGLTSNVHVRS